MVQLLVNGLAMGCIYALVGLGFILVFNSVGVLNFAQGEMVMLAAYLGVTFALWMHWPLLLAFVLAAIAMGVAGYLLQLVSYYPLRDKPLLTVIIATIGVGIALRNLALLVWGPNPFRLPSLVSEEPITVLGTVILPLHLFIVAVTGVLLLLQQLFFSRTIYGRMMRATAQDLETARIMGIRVRQTIATTFVLSAILAGVAGILLGPLFYVSIDMGLPVLLKAFSAVIIGGFGSIPGAIVGGLFLGVAEIFGAAYLSSQYKDAIAFGILILFLFAFPQGFFGEKIAEKA